MPELQYKITTAAELAGAQAAADALERQIGKAKALQQDYSDLQRQLDTVNDSLKNNVEKPLDKAGESAFQFSERGREMYRLFAELNRIIPGLGEALMGLNMVGFNPLLATLSLVAFGFYEVKKAVDDWNKSEDDAAKAAANPDFLAGIQAKIEVLNSAKTAAAEYAQKEQEVLNKEKDITTALTEQLQIMAALEQARGAESAAQKALALAKVDKLETEGQITPSQAIQERTNVESYYEAQDFARKQKAAQDEQAVKESALHDAEKRQEQADKAKQNADAKATTTAADYAEASKVYQAEYNTPEKTHAILAPLEQRANETRRLLQRMTGELDYLPPDKQAEALAPYQRGAQAAQQDLDRANKQIQFYTQHGGDVAKQNVDALQALAKAADQNADKIVSEVGALRKDVDEGKARLAGIGPLSASTESARQETIGVQETTALEKQAKGDVEKYQRDIKKGDLQGALNALRDLNDALAGHAEVLQYVIGLGVNVKNLQAIIAQLKREMAQNHAQVRSQLTP